MKEENVISIADLKSEIEKGHRLFKAYEKGLEIIPMLEGLEQRSIELQMRVDALLKMAEDLNRKNVEAKESCDRFDKKYNGLVGAAEEESKAVKLLAKKDADDIRAKALAEAEELREKIACATDELREKIGKIRAAEKDLEQLEIRKAEAAKKLKEFFS